MPSTADLQQRAGAHIQAGNFQEAITDLTTAIGQERNARTAALLHTFRAIAYQALDDAPAAIADYTAAIRLEPDDEANTTHRYTERAELYIQMGNIDAAMADFETLIRQFPESISGYSSRGLYYFNTGNWDAAIADWDTTYRMFPNAGVLILRGQAYTNAGQYKAALADFSACIRESQDNVVQRAGAHWYRAQVYTKLADAMPTMQQQYLSAAVEDLTHNVRLRPDAVDREKTQQQINELEGRLRQG